MKDIDTKRLNEVIQRGRNKWGEYICKIQGI